MKVKDLIKFLKGCNPNAEVVAAKYIGYDTVMPLHTVQEIPKGQATPDNVWLNKKNTYI